MILINILYMTLFVIFIQCRKKEQVARHTGQEGGGEDGDLGMLDQFCVMKGQVGNKDRHGKPDTGQQSQPGQVSPGHAFR